MKNTVFVFRCNFLSEAQVHQSGCSEKFTQHNLFFVWQKNQENILLEKMLGASALQLF